jgi:hypothetical protein
VLVVVAAASALVGMPAAGRAEPTAVPPASLEDRLRAQFPESSLPELTSVSPLDEGVALPPRRPVSQQPEQGTDRLGSAPVFLPPLTFTFKADPYEISP